MDINPKFPLQFRRIEVIPVAKDPAKVLVKWELEKTALVLNDFEFYVDRGEAPDQIPAFQHKNIDGKYVFPLPPTTHSINEFQISSAVNGLDFHEYLDFTPSLKNLFKMYYYRVRIRQISTQEELGSTPATWQGDLDLEGLYVVDEHNFMLEDTTGVPTLIYPRRRGGIQCIACFDPIQKKRINSHCTVCYGTNWQGGFYKPIDAFLDFSPSNDVTTIKDWGETQDNETDVLFTNYPVLEAGFVVRELRENRLWRVVKTRHTEKRRAPMLQFVRLTEIKPGDVEYQLHIDVKFLKEKIDQFEKIKKLRAF